MEIKRLLRTSIFLLAALFSFIDVAADISLAREYFLYGTCPPHFRQGHCQNVTTHGNVTNNGKGHFRLGVIWEFFVLTSIWICLGGLVETVIILRQMCRRSDSCLEPLTRPLRYLLLLTAPFLIAPVVVNIFAAFLVFRNRANVTDDIVK